MSKNRRTEAVAVKFVNRQAQGWVFGVADAFRTQLDIKLDERVDKDANKTKEAALGRKLEASEKVKRSVWTQGDPPAYAFDRGHVFHEPPECHTLPWNEALPLLKRSVTVLLAKPDAGALVETSAPDDVDDQSTAVIAPEVEHSGGGWVDYEVITYTDGVVVTDAAGLAVKEQSSRSQAGFAEFLRTGK